MTQGRSGQDRCLGLVRLARTGSGGSVVGTKARYALLAEELSADVALQPDGGAAREANVAHVAATAFLHRDALPLVLLAVGLAVGRHTQMLPRAGEAGTAAVWRSTEDCATVLPMRRAWAIIAVAFVFATGCAQKDWIDRTLVTVDVTGVWEGPQAGTIGAGGIIVFVLQQRGPKVTGEIRNLYTWPMPTAESTPIQGTVNGDTLSLHEVSGQTLRVVLQVNGDEMIGSMDRLSLSFSVSLRRQPAASPPR